MRSTPQTAQLLVDLWRPWIEEKAASRLDRLDGALFDQAAFARLARDLIAALDMADELGEDPDSGEDDEEQNRFDQGECIAACDALSRDDVGSELVKKHKACADAAKDDCAALLACK